MILSMSKRLFCILSIVLSSLVLQAQNDTVLKLAYALQNVDKKLLEANTMVDEYIANQFIEGNYDEVLKYAPYHLYGRMALVSMLYFSISEQEREELSYLIEGDLAFHYIMSAVMYTNKTEIMGIVYDYIIFAKQLQLRTEQKIRDVIQRTNDHRLLSTYNEYRQIKKQLAGSNPSPSLDRKALTERLNYLGRQLAIRSNLSLENDADLSEDIQKYLGNGEAAVEFIKFSVFKGKEITELNMYAALVLTRYSKIPAFIPMTTEKYLTYWKTENPSDLYDVNKYGAALSQFVWLNVADYLLQQSVTTIYFSPVGVLNNMAMESFPYDRESAMSYHFNLKRLTSTRQLLQKHNLHPKNTAALYGDLSYRMSSESMQQTASTRGAVMPLPWSKPEVDSIQKILSANSFTTKMNVRIQGTEASFKALDGHSPSIIHLATHGFVNRKSADGAMQKSGLIMAYGARAWEGASVPSGVDDGILTAAEIAALDLSGTDVVVLSGCKTALGDITTEGVWGLQRAFKQAGVRTIVMSLWQVDDEATSLLMYYFYQELMTHRKIFISTVSIDVEIAEHISYYAGEALFAAQRRLRKNPKYASPYYWAGFVVIE